MQSSVRHPAGIFSNWQLPAGTSQTRFPPEGTCSTEAWVPAHDNWPTQQAPLENHLRLDYCSHLLCSSGRYSKWFPTPGFPLKGQRVHRVGRGQQERLFVTLWEREHKLKGKQPGQRGLWREGQRKECRLKMGGSAASPALQEDGATGAQWALLLPPCQAWGQSGGH